MSLGLNEATEVSPQIIAGAVSSVFTFCAWIYWLYGPKQSTARQRRNHVKLVFQNVLVGQEALSVVTTESSLAKTTDDDFRASEAELSESREYAVGLCKRRSTLSADVLLKQVSLNRRYRKSFESFCSLYPYVYGGDFAETFRPTCGWDVFDKEFRRQPLLTLQKYDLFWPTNL